MKNISTSWRFLDHSTLGLNFDALQSFAYDDTLCTVVGQQDAPPTIRPWVHDNTIVLGIQDSRLPYIEDGQAYLESEGYRVVVRNSGGLAVVLDPGILNLSLIIKEEKGFTIDAGYELMYSFIQRLFADFPVHIEAKEIVGSYCPGSFDLSIGGKKFAGISQRRIRGGVAVQIYLCVDGSGEDRAQLIQNFYTKSVQGAPTKFNYPQIVPATMASLSDLLDTPLTITDIVGRILHSLHDEGIKLHIQALSPAEINMLQTHYERISQRNIKAMNLG